jgi:hypothetical protein
VVPTYVNIGEVDVRPEDLLDSGQVAEILGLSHRNTVSMYRRRHLDFPAPFVERDRCKLWLRKDIEAWAARSAGRRR